MMKRRHSLVSLGFATLLGGCEDASTGSGGASGGETGGSGGVGGGGAVNVGGGSGGSEVGGGGGGMATATIRLAHLSPDAPPIDFCLLPSGGAPLGPWLEASATPAGLVFPGASSYAEAPSGEYALRITLGDSTNCDTGVLPDITDITLLADKTYTFAAIGMLVPSAGDPSFSLMTYEDDNTSEVGMARMRFIHTAPGTPAVDVGLGYGDAFQPIWTQVAYPNVGLVKGQGYVSLTPPGNDRVTARASGTTNDLLIIDGVSVPPGEVVTSFAVGNLDGDPAALRILACVDTSNFCFEFTPN